MGSILNDTKKLLSIPSESEEFDQDIVLLINAALSRLGQIGVVGPTGKSYRISSEEDEWSDFEDRNDFGDLKAYVYVYVRILFDPPTVATVMNAFKEQMGALEWQLNVRREEERWNIRNTEKFL